MKQHTLWDEKTVKVEKTRIELYEPLPDKRKKCEDMLQYERVPDLLPKFQQIKSIVVARDPVIITANGENPLPQQLLDIITKKGNINKNELVSFISFFLADFRNFYAYFNSLDKEIQKVWTLIVENYFASNKLLKRKNGQYWMNIERSTYSFYSNSISLSEKLPWFLAMRSDISYELQDYYLFIPRQYRQYIYPIFLSKKINSYFPQADLPEEEVLHIFNEEKQIFRLLPVVESLYKQNLLPIAKYKISTAALKKAGKLLNACEFFPEDADNTASQLRTSMLLSAYGIQRAAKKEDDEPEVFIKNIIKNIIQYPGVLLTLSLPHVNGIKLKMLSDSYASIQATHILQLLSSCKSGLWTDVESIRLRLYDLEAEGCQNLLFNGIALQKAEFVNTKQNKEYILLEDLYNEISVPFIKGFFFLLASFGLVEMAYSDHDPDSSSYCCSLRYIRLTMLGEYALGLKKEYTPEINEEILFEVNADDLIIRSVSETNPYEALMTDIGIPIGGHRYKITSGSFLKNCRKRGDIENKISFFKKHVSKQPPQNWEDFFQSTLQHCNPLQKVNLEKYDIYQLRAEDKELQRLVSTDPYLRQYTKRAEDFLLLIEKKHLNEVVNRLKSFGYLL